MDQLVRVRPYAPTLPVFSQNMPPVILSIVDFVIGFIFGTIVIVTNFCAMGAMGAIADG